MSAAPVQIAQLRQRFVCADPADAPAVAARTRDWAEELAMLGEAAWAGPVPDDDEWILIPQLQVHSRVRADATTLQWGRDWLQAVGQAVHTCLQAPVAHAVVRYRRRTDALADLLYRSAAGDTTRQWAWHRMGLLRSPALSSAEALQQGWQALVAEPEVVTPALQALLQAEAQTGAWSALVRRLPSASWAALTLALPAAWAGVSKARGAPGSDLQPVHATPTPLVWPEGGLHAAWRHWVARQPALAARLQRHGGEAVAAWLASARWPFADAGQAAVLWPSWHALACGGAPTSRLSAWSPASGTAPRAVEASASAQVRASVDPTDPSHAPCDADAAPGAAVQAPTDVAPREDVPALPELPARDERTSWPTSWAGACFWLARVPAVWPALRATVPAYWPDAAVGRALAEVLGIPPTDPVWALWTGGFSSGDGERGGDGEWGIPTALRHAAQQQVQVWADWLWSSLSADRDGAQWAEAQAALNWLNQRPARLRVEPGWVEVGFDADQTDTRIRRLALDLDPGWVPLAQAVVRFRYG